MVTAKEVSKVVQRSSNFIYRNLFSIVTIHLPSCPVHPRASTPYATVMLATIVDLSIFTQSFIVLSLTF